MANEKERIKHENYAGKMREQNGMAHVKPHQPDYLHHWMGFRNCSPASMDMYKFESSALYHFYRNEIATRFYCRQYRMCASGYSHGMGSLRCDEIFPRFSSQTEKSLHSIFIVLLLKEPHSPVSSEKSFLFNVNSATVWVPIPRRW